MTLLEGTRRIEDWEVKQLDRFTEMGFALRPIKPQKQRTTREEELLTWFKRPLTCFRHPLKSVYVCVDNFRLFKYRYQTLNLIKIKVRSSVSVAPGEEKLRHQPCHDVAPRSR